MRSIRICGTLWLALVAPIFAQQGPERGQVPGGPAREKAGPRPMLPRKVNPWGAGARDSGLPPRGPALLGPANALDRWNRMTPEQRDRAMAKLPPERQQRIRERLERFNALPERERNRLRARYDAFAKLPPEKQQLLRNDIQELGRLPGERRPVVAREFNRLRRMSEAEREARIESEDFQKTFNPAEQKILTGLAENVPLPPE